MRITTLFFIYLCVCLALAAWLTEPLLATGWIALEPHRVMGRLAQVMILLGIWPFLRSLSLADRAALGYGVAKPVWRRAVALGWLLGVMILLVLTLALLALDIRVPDWQALSWLKIISKAFQALIGGMLVGVLEEIFFRGALYSAIRRRDSIRAAAIWSALLYALVHVMKPGALPAGMVFDASGALWMFTHVFTNALDWQHLDSFTALFGVGILLALVREHTGHIGWCIGLHAGWVFVIQMTRHLTDAHDAAPLSFLVGHYDGISGWLAAFWIGLLAVMYWWLIQRRQFALGR